MNMINMNNTKDKQIKAEAYISDRKVRASDNQ